MSAAPLSMRSLLETLAARGVAPKELLDPADERARRAREAVRLEGDEPPPWFVRALIGAGTWVSAAIFAVFAGVLLGLLGLESPAALGVMGALLVLGAALLSRARVLGALRVLVSQLTLIGASAGGLLLTASLLAGRGVSGEATAACTLAIAAAIAAAVADGAVRFLGAACACGAAIALTIALEMRSGPLAVEAMALAGAIACFVPDGLLCRRGLRGLARPVGLGLAVSSVAAIGIGVVEPRWAADRSALLGAHAVFGLLLVYVAGLALQERGGRVASAGGAALLGTIAAAGAATAGAPGILAALAVLALGQLRGEPVLRGLGLVGLGGHLALFFSDEARGSLLDRGVALLGAGLALLVGRALLARFFTPAADLEAIEGAPAPTPAAAVPAAPAWRPRPAEVVFVATAALVIGATALTASRRERLLAEGTEVILEASSYGVGRAPLVGDSASVHFRLLESVTVPAEAERSVRIVVAPDAEGVWRFARLDEGRPLAEGEARIEVRFNRREGDGSPSDMRIAGNVLYLPSEEYPYSSQGEVRYALLRVDASGDAIVTALLDERRVKVRER